MDRRRCKVSILYPGFLWLLVPLCILFFYREKKAVETVHLIVLACIVLALSRPILMQGVQESPVKAREYIIALDVSYSMRAKDLPPDRYTFAKQTISALLDLNPADNIMLIAFTTNPLLLSPPTTDHRLINVALKSLNPEYILTKGTSIKKLLKKIADIKQREKYLVLMTDGGEEKEAETLKRLTEKGHIHPIILALGTKQGATVEKADGTLLKDKEGHLVVSRINPLLSSFASETGGVYLVPSSSPEATAQALHKALRSQTEHTQEVTKKQHRHTELYPLPLLVALLLFLAVHTRAAKYLLAILALMGIQAEASILDGYRLHQAYSAYEAHDLNRSEHYLNMLSAPSLQSRFAQASLYYRQGEYDKALRYYLSIQSTSEQVKQSLYYNIGNCYARKGAYGKAKIYYTKALQLGEDADAQANLALVALLEDKKNAKLGLAHPKSQGSDVSKSAKQEEDNKKKSRNEEQQSSGGGSGGENSKSKKEQAKHTLVLDPKAKKQPLSSKVYDLINKGYIHEQKPW